MKLTAPSAGAAKPTADASSETGAKSTGPVISAADAVDVGIMRDGADTPRLMVAVSDLQAVFTVPPETGDAAKEYVRDHIHELFRAANEVIAATPRKGDVKSLTDPAHFKQRKEPIENVHKAILDNWDDLKRDKALFVFIISLKFGIKTVKRARAPAPDAADDAPIVDGKRRKVRKQLVVAEVDEVLRTMVDRCGTTVAKLCAVIRRLRQELSDAQVHAAAANTANVRAAYGFGAGAIANIDSTHANTNAAATIARPVSRPPSEAGELI